MNAMLIYSIFTIFLVLHIIFFPSMTNGLPDEEDHGSYIFNEHVLLNKNVNM